MSAINRLIGDFPGLARSEAGQLISLAAQARRAGSLVALSPQDATSGVAAMPINPQLFGATPEGKRYQYDVETRVIDKQTGETLFTFSYVYNEGRMQTAESLLARALESVTKATDRYPEIRELLGEDDAYDFETVILTAQRRY